MQTQPTAAAEDTAVQQNDFETLRATAERDARLAELMSELTLLRSQLVTAETELEKVPQLETEIEELTTLNSELLRRVDELNREGEDLDELQAIADRYETVIGSSSWTMTRPLRRIAALLRQLRG